MHGPAVSGIDLANPRLSINNPRPTEPRCQLAACQNELRLRNDLTCSFGRPPCNRGIGYWLVTCPPAV
jgi:hypothetical protein